MSKKTKKNLGADAPLTQKLFTYTGKFRRAYEYNKHSEVKKSSAYYESGQSRTQQHELPDSDIQKIVARSIETGILPERRELTYGDLRVNDYKEALDKVTRAQQDFDELPSKLRDRFRNDPKELIQFLSDSKNREEAEQLGLIHPKQPPEASKSAGTADPAPGKPDAS